MFEVPALQSQVDVAMFTAILLAQSGMAKTAIGWGLVFLCVLLGALPVVNPFGRKPEKKSEDKR